MPSAPLGIVASHDHFKEATGGTITYSGGYTIHTFNSSGTFTIGAKGKRLIEWEVIGAGGPGASSGPAGKVSPANVGGGGGGGGRIIDSATLSPFYTGSGVVTGIPVTVGAGAAFGAVTGNPSSFLRQGGTETTVPDWNGKATGANGGGPAWYLGPSEPGNTWGGSTSGYGGSGAGGNGADADGVAGKPGATPGGEAGGNGSSGYKGGGGGGEGAAGASGADGGNGGAGVSGVCGGGGGGVSSGTAGTASDGGGAGKSGSGAPTAGTANTGGGGGGAGNTATATNGANGGSGKVIIKYLSV